MEIRNFKKNAMRDALDNTKGKENGGVALAGMDNQLFVSTYMLQLPDRKTLEDFLLKQLGE